MSEFWLMSPGLFDDMIAAWQIIHGAKQAPAKQARKEYNDDSIFDLL